MTAWARKYRLLLIGSVAVLAVLCASAVCIYKNDSSSTGGLTPNLILNDHRFAVIEYANTPEQQGKGLSGRDTIAPDQAMIFRFDTLSQQCFWMKDMKFSIDMVWLDAADRVTAIEKNVSPSTYPNRFCHDGTKVIEVTAGTADKLLLQVGDQAHL